MKSIKAATLLTTTVNLARALGGLDHRALVLENQLKGLSLQAKEDSVLLTRKPRHMEKWKRAEYRQDLQDHGEFLARTRCLVEEELGLQPDKRGARKKGASCVVPSRIEVSP